MGTVDGTAEPRFDRLRERLQANLDDGTEAGASVCAVHDGRVVVDLWGGLADVETGTAWQRDTVVNTFSLTKTMTALAALLLVDAGQLDLDAPVAAYWPEFAEAGKAGVLVRHVLGHTSGVSGWEQEVTLADLYDTEAASALLAAQAPWWSPGSASGYHALSQGHLVGEIVLRVTGQTLGQFFAAEIGGPMRADYYIGTPERVDPRIAIMVAPPRSEVDLKALPPQSLTRKTLLNPGVDVRQVRTRQWREAELGAVNGHGNARSVATVQALVSHGGSVDGGPALRRSTIDRIFEVQADGIDQVLGLPLRFGIGYGLAHPSAQPEIRQGRVCWWTGYGGSIVINDLDRRLTIAYVMNKMGSALIGLARGAQYLQAVYEALDS
ncbi:MAG: beta-lactamase family protein [Actinomycetota bacterium]|nr:beta-lactamase family protein [Actinomycetota bacterium]